jgi:hypothetical protein
MAIKMGIIDITIRFQLPIVKIVLCNIEGWQTVTVVLQSVTGPNAVGYWPQGGCNGVTHKWLKEGKQ